MTQITLGGERLGSGKKEKVYLRNYERSTHDLSYVWRSTMAAGTLVPFMSEVALPGDTFDIDLNCNILTHPTIGPLFGSYKVQLDVFQIPIRLYQGQLHMNKLGIGLKMSDVKLPQITLRGNKLNPKKPIDNQHINPSCIFSYLNIRGLGASAETVSENNPIRQFNAIPYLAYWDIYKNYYANKQEEIGAVIHNDITAIEASELANSISSGGTSGIFSLPMSNNIDTLTTFNERNIDSNTFTLTINSTNAEILNKDVLSRISIVFRWWNGDVNDTEATYIIPLDKYLKNWESTNNNEGFQGTIIADEYLKTYGIQNFWYAGLLIDESINDVNDLEPTIETFDLSNIDIMRERILMAVQSGTPFVINTLTDLAPYTLPLQSKAYGDNAFFSIQSNQEGLALKTYQSDLFNNWISTEWIDGENGINEITKIDTSDGNFTIDELLLSKKIYDMLNRIAISGGSYDDWLDATYTHDRMRSAENPIYMGGLIKELTFQEVISNSESQNGEQPLGTLAGRGVLTNKHKGGKIRIKTDEPSYIMGLISLTPRLDYSQGNKWDTNLKTMDDFHKPALDEIGFQDLITDQMAWWDTQVLNNSNQIFKSAGKQPAWINYMTNVNQVRGNFAIEDDQMFMVLTRRYEPIFQTFGDYTVASIRDLTTYIDPVKFNHIFAYTRRDAQNFWSQIKVDITARRKMSAKVMPNL